MAGRPPTVTDKEILEFFIESPDPFLTTVEVGELAEMSQQGAYNRLEDLENGGYVRSKSMGNARGWWITQAGRELVRNTKKD